MEKYRLVKEQKGDGEDFLESTTDFEVRITQQGKPRNYISYAMGLLVSFHFFFNSLSMNCFRVSNKFTGVVGSKKGRIGNHCPQGHGPSNQQSGYNS